MITCCRPTFYRIYKRKSAEGFHSLPYIVALFSAMLWLYYALLKKDAFLLITINCFGCAIESFYILLYFFYAPMQAKVFCYTEKYFKVLCVSPSIGLIFL